MSDYLDTPLSEWVYPRWEEIEPGYWHLLQGINLVGEAYEREGGGIKWHCKTSDWRDTNALSIEQAKAECEASFWKEAWHRASGHHRSSSVTPL